MDGIRKMLCSIPPGVPGGFFIYDAHGNEEICYVDQNVIELFGCSTVEEFQELTGNSFRGMVYPEDLEQVESDILAQTFSSGQRHDYVRYRIRTKQGKIRYLEDFGHLMYSSNGMSYYYVFVVDVEENEYFNKRRNSFAESEVFAMNNRIDPLTGLLNMASFYEKAQLSVLDRASDGIGPSTIVVFDIIGLREVNQAMGRDEGDARIVALSQAVRSCMSENTYVFRGHESELIAMCRDRSENEIMSEVMDVVNACKSRVMFGIGTTGGMISGHAYAEEHGTVLQALEEAYNDLNIKKMLNSESARSQALTSLVRALEEVDADTEAHVQRTQKMGLALGRKIGLSDSQLTTLQLLCLLHDIGKITVPLEILNKPGRLTDEEWATLRSHSDKGYQIAMASDELKPIAELIRFHHERWDGRGYPDRLSREEIPVLSRIISIVDAYDAMVNDRAYRKAMQPEAAQKEIRDNAGTQFDPHIAEAFLAMLEEEPSLAVGAKTGGGDVRLFEDTAGEDPENGNTTPVFYSKYMLDIDDRIIRIDEYFEGMTGYSEEDAVGKMTQKDLIPPEDWAQYNAQVRDAFMRTGDIAYLRHRILRKDGTIIEVICHGERYFDSSVREFRSTVLVFEV